MSLEQQVCSLELAKKLKELGVIKESLFYWSSCSHCTAEYGVEEWSLQEGMDYGDNYSAFTSSELLEIINAFIRISKDVDSNISVYYQPEHGTDNSYTFEGNNLADLLAQVLIAQINENEFKA